MSYYSYYVVNACIQDKSISTTTSFCRMYVHEDYQKLDHVSTDIAILELEEPLDFGKTMGIIEPACLPTKPVYTGEPVSLILYYGLCI